MAITQNRYFQNYDELIKKFYKSCEEEMILAGEQRIHASIASGRAVNNPHTDNSFMDVFNRVDDRMCEISGK